MFAPDGYLNLAEIGALCNQVASSVWTAKNLSGLDESSELDLGSQNPEEMARELFLERNYFTAWLLAQAVENWDPVICTHDSHVFKASALTVFHEDHLSWYDWEWPTKSRSELSVGFERYIRTGEHPMSRFRFIDVITGTISIRHRELDIQKFAHEAEEDLRQQIFALKKFDGAAVCFEEDSIPEGTKDILDSFGLNEPFATSAVTLVQARQGETSRAGRPSLRNITADAYWSAYPDGHGEAAWVEVEERLKVIIGRKVSYKTIKRSIERGQDKTDKLPDKT